MVNHFESTFIWTISYSLYDIVQKENKTKAVQYAQNKNTKKEGLIDDKEKLNRTEGNFFCVV